MNQIEFVQSLLRQAIVNVNSGVSKTLTARLSSEIPPVDTRHLTDTRTRVSTQLEFSLAFEMNHLLITQGNRFSVSSVLWNVFPDLFIRDQNRNPVIGLEVKALHTAAEEKSANLSTPLQVMKKGSDFVVILIWAWRRELINGVSVTYPHIHLTEVFDAYLLAQVRDYSWLLKQGTRIKGIDFGRPIISSETNKANFKAEEGNMGKLMRIKLDPQLPISIPNLDELKRESKRYEQFKEQILGLGLTETFHEICDLQQCTEILCHPLQNYPTTLIEIGRSRLLSGSLFCLFAGGNVSRLDQTLRNSELHPIGSVALWLARNLKWIIVKKTDSTWRQIANGNKPDTAYEQIKNALAN